MRNTRVLAPECLEEKSPATLSVFPRAQALSGLPLQPSSTRAAKETFFLLAVILHIVTRLKQWLRLSSPDMSMVWELQHVTGVLCSLYSALTFSSLFQLLLLLATRIYLRYIVSHYRFTQYSIPLQKQPLKSYRPSQRTFPAVSVSETTLPEKLPFCQTAFSSI